jgi:hypothetical protein
MFGPEMLMHWTPATFSTLLVTGLLFMLAGLFRRAGRGLSVRMCRNPGCGHGNPPNARYCARCGRRLPSSCCEW